MKHVLLALALAGAIAISGCGSPAVPSPSPLPSGSHLLWRAHLTDGQFIAAQTRPLDLTSGAFWVSLSVKGQTGSGDNAIVFFGPYPPATASPSPGTGDVQLGRGWRVNDGDRIARRIVVPPGTYIWNVQKGTGYSVQVAVYETP